MVLSRADRVLALVWLMLSMLWLAYTRAYFWLHPRGLTFAPSLFMYLTGRPDPLCGLTRTFAWMWRGGLSQAVRVYPLGPIAFILGILLAAYAAAVALSGRGVRIHLSPRQRRAILITCGLALTANWAAKLLWLGM